MLPYNNYCLKLKMFHFQHQKIIPSSLLIYSQELEDLEWQCKILGVNVFLQVNGMKMQKKPIVQILEKHLLGTSQKNELKIISLMILMFCVQDFLVKPFQ